ncbi:sulfate adenylyltransferase subunit CysN [Salinibius halmophilus]|uniref:sulfate adenylyltransferase subunit CysN n=1 Tax=Salinibius halmophilus TaxID=1853216 RepID=UPI000E6740ED|nr:sulfate adenylyltransferase subunit CysN [Salinibius halmophilus]
MAHQSELIAQDINEYLEQHERKELLRLLTCGSVDDGKSTLIGRLLHDSKMIFEDQLAAIANDSKKVGTQGDKIDLALLVDGLAAEREQGITIDVAYRYFSTDRRKFIIADTPGHEQYTRNMATGASTADLAIILVDARHGVMTQTRRHTYLAHLLGIKHIVVAINKMDLVDFSEDRFNEIKADYQAFADQLGVEHPIYVPISALDGDNVVSNSEKSPWYTDKPLMQILEEVQIVDKKDLARFRLPVQYVNRPNLNFRGFAGTIAAGKVHPGDEVIALPSGKRSKVKEIVTFDGNLDEAFVNQAVTITLQDEIDVSRGDMLVGVEDQPVTSNSIDATLVWMHDQAMQPGKLYDIKVGTNMASGTVSNIAHRIDVNTLEKHDAKQLELNEIAECTVTLNKSIAFDPYSVNRHTGAFIVIDRLTNVTVGAGMITGKADTSSDKDPVTADERAKRFGQHARAVNVSTSELAIALERRLFDAGHAVVRIDSPDHGATKALLNAGLIVICQNNVEADTLDGDNVDQLLNQLTASHDLD